MGDVSGGRQTPCPAGLPYPPPPLEMESGGKVSILISRYTIVAFEKREARLKEKGTLLLENKYTNKRFRYLK